MYSCDSICVFQVAVDGLDIFSIANLPSNPDLHWLIENIQSQEGDDQVVVTLHANEDGTLYDIKLNGRSVGYYSLKVFSDLLSTITMPDLLVRGKRNLLDLKTMARVYKHIYSVPLFGDFE